MRRPVSRSFLACNQIVRGYICQPRQLQIMSLLLLLLAILHYDKAHALAIRTNYNQSRRLYQSSRVREWLP
jgi:hypothetical protein